MQVAYCFTGQGSQYPGVGKSLMGFPVYKKTVEAVDKLFKACRVLGPMCLTARWCDERSKVS